MVKWEDWGREKSIEKTTLQLLVHRSLLTLARRLRLINLSLLLPIPTGGSILRRRRSSIIINASRRSITNTATTDRLLIDALNIRMRRRNTGSTGGPELLRVGNLIPELVDDSSPSLVFCLEFNFTLQGFHLLLVEEVAVRIAVLDLLLLDDAGLALRSVRDAGGLLGATALVAGGLRVDGLGRGCGSGAGLDGVEGVLVVLRNHSQLVTHVGAS